MSGQLCLRNRQRLRSINLPLLRRIAFALLEDLFPTKPFELDVHLVRAPEIMRLNKTFLHHPGSTDVITFDHAGQPEAAAGRRPNPRASGASTPLTARPPGASAPIHGELFVCLDEAVAQSRRFNTIWQSELVRYLVHGVLHLIGYDDRQPAVRRRMKREENRLLAQLARRFSFRRLAKARSAD